MDVPDNPGNTEIPPMLFISFVENAFKHGISYKKDSFVDVRLFRDGDKVHFNCRNSMHPANGSKTEGGIGIDNTVRRLDLIYKDNYSLDISSNDDVFSVSLTIPTDKKQKT